MFRASIDLEQSLDMLVISVETSSGDSGVFMSSSSLRNVSPNDSLDSRESFLPVPRLEYLGGYKDKLEYLGGSLVDKLE